MREWHRILERVRKHGERRQDRTGAGTLALFGEQLVFDNSGAAFPAVTSKRLAFGQVAAELACFLQGYDNLKDFHEMGCRIWDGNGTSEYWLPHARSEGDLGRIYGVQWRDWHSYKNGALVQVDQLKALVQRMLEQPHGRRHIVTALNPGELDQICLPPCHVLFQAFLSGSESQTRVDIRVDMRSVDLFLGLPFDVASYALLQRLLANDLNVASGFLIFQLGDTHIYMNHMEQVSQVLNNPIFTPPTLRLAPNVGLFNFMPSDASLMDYSHAGVVNAPLNV